MRGLARLFRGRLLRFFGKYSYGLYVYHGLFTWYLLEVQANERLDRWFGGHHGLTLVARVVLGVGVSGVVAVLSYELMEKKFLGLKRYFESRAPQDVSGGGAGRRGAAHHDPSTAPIRRSRPMKSTRRRALRMGVRPACSRSSAPSQAVITPRAAGFRSGLSVAST